MAYYGIQFRCRTSQHGDQDRFIGYGMEKEGELSEDDIAMAKKELINTTRAHGIEVLEYQRHQEYTPEEWAELTNIKRNGPL